MAEFSTILRDDNDVSVIELKGFLDAHTAPQLENSFIDLINKKRYKIIVNFKNLEYISSAGLGVFMAFVETVRDNGGDIKMTNMTTKVYNIFDLLGFPLLYQIFETEVEAINKFNEA